MSITENSSQVAHSVNNRKRCKPRRDRSVVMMNGLMD